jgi:hypothetical protein
MAGHQNVIRASDAARASASEFKATCLSAAGDEWAASATDPLSGRGRR